jgi:hypothetical protein
MGSGMTLSLLPPRKNLGSRYTGRDSKIGRCQGDALNLSQAKLALKADKLKKFINASGSQMQWPFDVGRTNF